jgi:hypothetical protein
VIGTRLLHHLASVTFTSEPTKCPRQAEATMAIQVAHRPRWRRNTWTRRAILLDRIRNDWNRWLDRLEQRGWSLPRRRRVYGGTRWPGGPRPRTCSYCGSAHPDDAIRMVLAGWDVEATTKSYKRYLHPPGWAEARRRWHVAVRAGVDPVESFGGPASPVPPVKVYVTHFNDTQRQAFNAALHAADDRAEKRTH